MSAAIDLLDELETAGVLVWCERGLLHYKARAGVMTADRLARLRSHKAALLDLLSGEVARASPKTLLLTFEVDGKRAIYRDPLNEPIGDAIKALSMVYGKRLGSVWHNGVIVYPAE